MTAPSTGPRPESGSARRAWIVSALMHVLVIAGLATFALLAPPPPPTVAIFELVSVEKPKLRPLAPKTPEPPPPETPPESRPPVAKPKQPAPPKPEPKVVRPAAPDTSLPVRETQREHATNSPVQVSNVPSNPRLAFWAGRVKAIVESKWNPPRGIEVDGPVKTEVRFLVAVEDGVISRVEVGQSSGNKLLDDEAVRAVRRQASLPPPRASLPESFTEEFLQVSYEFVYKGQ